MNIERERLRKEFERETDKTAVFDRGHHHIVGTMNYVEFLEEKWAELLEQRAEPASAVDTIVGNTVGMQINEDFNGGKILMDTDLWDVLKKYTGKTISARTKEIDIHIVIKE